MTFIEKKFNIGELNGISAKAIEEHLKLYAGYVKHANLIIDKIKEYSVDATANAFVLGELQRRFGFEFDGIRNHEYYFEQFEGSAKPLNPESELGKKIAETWGSFDTWLTQFKTVCLTRGIGWAILYYDKTTDRLLHAWVDEQHLGHLTGLDLIFAVDMWEHSYLFDYVPADKKKYVEAVFENLNASIVEARFARFVA